MSAMTTHLLFANPLRPVYLRSGIAIVEDQLGIEHSAGREERSVRLRNANTHSAVKQGFLKRCCSNSSGVRARTASGASAKASGASLARSGVMAAVRTLERVGTDIVIVYPSGEGTSACRNRPRCSARTMSREVEQARECEAKARWRKAHGRVAAGSRRRGFRSLNGNMRLGTRFGESRGKGHGNAIEDDVTMCWRSAASSGRGAKREVARASAWERGPNAAGCLASRQTHRRRGGGTSTSG
jgi:hypothetical protein